MAQSASGREFARKKLKSRKRNPIAGTCFLALITSSLLFLFTAQGWTQDSPTLEERLSRMEREIQLLKARNADLESEISSMREQLADQQESAIDAAREIASKAIEESKPQIEVAYKKGLSIASEDDNFKLKVGGRVTTRFTAFDSGYPSDDEFSVSRARIYALVSLLDHYDLKIQTEFSKDPTLKDGYLNIHYVPWAEVKVGQFKPPYTWENLQSHKYLDFVDRSIAVNNMRKPSRDIGVMLHGKLLDNRLKYQLAVLNGSGENKGDDNDAKDIAGRLALQPFRGEENGILSKLHLGVSGTAGDQNKDFSSESFKTIGGAAFVDFADDTLQTGNRIRLGTEVIWPMGPASLKAEWTHMQLDNFKLGALDEDLDFYAWYVSASYILTCEDKTLGRLSPSRPLDPSKNAWGAWELAARYSVFKSDSDLFKLGMATGTDRAEAFTIGLNWYLNDFLRVIFDFEHTDFDDDVIAGGKTLDDEDAFLVRCQLEF